MNGSAADVEHAIWLAEHRSLAAPAAVATAAFWLDRRLREASSGEGRTQLVAQRKRLTEAAANGGVRLAESVEQGGAGAAGPSTTDFTELGLTEVEASSAVEGLRAGRYLSFEDAFWSTRIFESSAPASAPDAVKLREKALKFAGGRPAETKGQVTTPWGRSVTDSASR